MALVQADDRIKLDIPHEPGEWIEVRPIVQGDLRGVTSQDGPSLGLALMERAITAWSYPDPLTKDNVRRLDLQTAAWLDKELARICGVRTEDEKNGSTPSS